MDQAGHQVRADRDRAVLVVPPLAQGAHRRAVPQHSDDEPHVAAVGVGGQVLDGLVGVGRAGRARPRAARRPARAAMAAPSTSGGQASVPSIDSIEEVGARPSCSTAVRWCGSGGVAPRRRGAAQAGLAGEQLAGSGPGRTAAAAGPSRSRRRAARPRRRRPSPATAQVSVTLTSRHIVSRPTCCREPGNLRSSR